jgi:hypothetical protein
MPIRSIAGPRSYCRPPVEPRTVEATANAASGEGDPDGRVRHVEGAPEGQRAGRRIRWLVSAEGLASAAAGNGEPAPLLALEVCRRVHPSVAERPGARMAWTPDPGRGKTAQG